MKKLPRSFYTRPTLAVAQELLGKCLVRQIRGVKLSGTIVETEAYCANDPASHAFRGRTLRNDVMFRKGGHLYVYFTYGMHFCANVVTGDEGVGEAVLIRAIEPVDGIDLMIRNRSKGRPPRSTDHFPSTDLTNGPAKLCEALHIRREENGVDLLGQEIFILDAPITPASMVKRTTRIGIRKGREKKWRLFIRGNVWVSS